MTPRQTIAHLGGPGTYSHLGCRNRFPTDDYLPCASFDEAFRAVQRGLADRALIPLENSLAGRVADVHFLLPESGLRIVEELFLPIRHCLLGLPGADPAGLRAVHSHPQALGQCRAYLEKTGLRAVAAPDTASAARDVAATGDPGLAAIADRTSGELFGLHVLADDIADHVANFTRFVVLARKAEERKNGYLADLLTTLTFDLGGNPADLHRALGVFAAQGIAVTRVESYLSRDTFASSSFMIDILGCPHESRVRRAITALQGIARRTGILGTYEAQRAFFAGVAPQ